MATLYDIIQLYGVLVWKHEGKRPLGRPKLRREVFRMDLQEVRWGMDWDQVAQDWYRSCALVNALMNLRVL